MEMICLQSAQGYIVLPLKMRVFKLFIIVEETQSNGHWDRPDALRIVQMKDIMF